jgi:hypothetical protein
MWSGPDGPLGPAEVAAEGRFAGPWQNHDRYGEAYLAWFFLTGKRILPTYFPAKMSPIQENNNMIVTGGLTRYNNLSSWK